ncbi:hypothetical protein [Saccharopolyspora hattusasensis]|uniref:hypothetical protein n=1 Tax=Saccharopolyspora hattusasensis TaxID=1128679 RepID=UPI003D96D27A
MTKEALSLLIVAVCLIGAALLLWGGVPLLLLWLGICAAGGAVANLEIGGDDT